MNTLRLFLAAAFLSSVIATFGQELKRFEIGPQFSRYRIMGPHTGCVGCMGDEIGLGFNAAANFTRWGATDFSYTHYFATPDIGGSNVYGGGLTQLQAGMKLGFRAKRWGVFGKARPGFVRWSKAITGFTNNPNPTSPQDFFTFGPVYHLTIETGGVLELYPAKRYLLRADYGFTHIKIGEGAGMIWQHTGQFSTAIMFRF